MLTICIFTENSLLLHSLIINSTSNSKIISPFLFVVLLLVSVCVWAEGADQYLAKDESSIEYTFEHFSYAGPMAVMQLANDWNGDIKQGDDAVSFIQSEISAKTNHFLLGFLTRYYHQFSIGNDLARGFYYYNNDISLGEELRIDAAMQARVYSGTGLRLGYEFLFNPFSRTRLSVIPSFVVLRLDDIIWGGLEGELFYSDTNNWGGTIDLDYGYTKDHVVRRPLKGEYLGQLYGLDLDLNWQSPWLSFDYQGINLYSRIYWDGLPQTTAQVSTETAFFLFGYEYFDDVVLQAPALHYAQASGPFPIVANSKFHWLSSVRVTPVKSFYYHGLRYRSEVDLFDRLQVFKLGLQYDFSSSTSRISFEHSNVTAVLASQTLDLSKSQQLVAKFTFHYSF